MVRTEQSTLFDRPGFAPAPAALEPRPLREMSRATDLPTSKAAAVRIRPHVSAVQQRVLACLAAHGPATGREIESRPEFADLGPWIVRRRLSDLYKLGQIRPCGTRDRMSVWGLT